MNIRFSIHYQTAWGQEVRLVGSSPELGEWDYERAPVMAYIPGGTWGLNVALKGGVREALAYKYCVVHASGGVEWEWGPDRTLPADLGKVAHVVVEDVWRAHGNPEYALTTAAFSRAILGGAQAAAVAGTGGGGKSGPRCRLRVTAPRVPAGFVVGVMGSDPALGSWESADVVLLGNAGYPEWETEVRLKTRNVPVQYKYVLYDVAAKRVTQWEAGANRAIWPDPLTQGARALVRNDGLFRQSGGLWRGAGVAVPVFSLRSERGLGVGEFADLKKLVDWACAAGLKMIQILPVNDTVATHTWVDSYPYAAVSVFALHPIYMRLEDMGVLDAAKVEAIVEPHRRRLNGLPAVDYEAVMAVKSRFYKLAYDASRDAFLADPEFVRFFAENRTWLVPYAVFSCLRDRYGTSDYGQWPAHREMTTAELAEFSSPDRAHYDDVAVHYFIQYHLHRQLLDAANYARSRGVALKGDIPIGVYRHSVDTWMDRRSFDLNSQAGAPPDGFAVDGQNWGFPTYNWDVMAADGYQWWRRRLTHLATYFDAFRIDHILGFFRIWEIPLAHVQGILGHFNPAYTVTRDELASRGMWFDEGRLCTPYMRRHVVDAVCGSLADTAVALFLDDAGHGQYRLKAEFATQRAVDRYLAGDAAEHPERAARNAALKWAMFRLIAEVVFLPAGGEGGGAYYPRHSLHSTHSYRDLDADMRWKLDQLYIDYFYKRHENFWRDQAMVRLPAVRNATNMLICGEDLGMVPDCVPGVMNELGILSLFIQRMPKDPTREFSHPADCPYLSVCSPSTHDMSTLRGWWREDRGRTQRFFNVIMGRWGAAPEAAEAWVCRDIITQHLYSPSMWAVFPLQDLLAMDEALWRSDVEEERINVPSNPQHYWRYRMHLSLDALTRATGFNGMLRDLVTQAGRNSEA